MANPCVSVIIPTYNRSAALKEAIISALGQSLEDKEIIVVNDGSTDNTHEIVKSFGDKVKYVYQENQGVSSARNLGIAHAKGDYTAFLDSDDVWLPDKLKLQVDDMERHPECIIHLTNAIVDRPHLGTFNLFENAGLGVLKEKVVPRPLLPLMAYDMARVQNCMVRTNLLKNNGTVFSVSLPIYEDLDFFLRFSLAGAWCLSSMPLTKILRREEKTNNLSSLRLKDSHKNNEYLCDIYKRLLARRELNKRESKMVSRCLAGYMRHRGYILISVKEYSKAKDAFAQSLAYSFGFKSLLLFIFMKVNPRLLNSVATRRAIYEY